MWLARAQTESSAPCEPGEGGSCERFVCVSDLSVRKLPGSRRNQWAGRASGVFTARRLRAGARRGGSGARMKNENVDIEKSSYEKKPGAAARNPCALAELEYLY